MENPNAKKLILDLQTYVDKNGLTHDINYVIVELKKIRKYELDMEIPSVVKVLRLTYEHLESENDFLIAIPNDEPLEENAETDKIYAEDSFKFMLNLILDPTNKHNMEDLKYYNQQLMNF